ncbi:unnamed protein product [Polarella glacialis]|uniref:Cation/H+ exchanger transmembrane domain-containing protein n=1 Tax=Polarella glacialis TaxID=89957 RepID=A0A813D8K1_POLGL|nr:unnamed protein product [Polarella glacialis]
MLCRRVIAEVSSIVLEVAVGVVLGPGVLSLIPEELTECYHKRATNCDGRSAQAKIAEMGTEFCDLGAYLSAGKYVAEGIDWEDGFWGNTSHLVDLHGHVYHLNETDQHRRLSGGAEGKTDYKTYSDCNRISCELDLATKCALTPDIFTLCGHIGVALMIFESGMHFDFEQAKTVGPWACAVAVLGTVLPIIGGAGVAVAFGYPLYPDGMAVGTSLAPTSIGIALKLLHEARALQTYFGQAVMTAAFVDDVLSLILFSVLFSMRGGTLDFMTFLPLILGCLFMLVSIIAAVKVWPTLIKCIFSKVPETKAGHKITRHDEVMWLLMFALLLAYSTITHFCGTHLWGCFMAGMSFAGEHHAHHVWVRQVKRHTCWLIRLFFACTLAWSIPINDLFTFDAFWKGTVMGIGPCVLTKVICAPFMGGPRWVIGWAMVGRAEFAYFIAIMSKSLNMMEDKLFAILVWALIYATIFAPLIFRKVLANYLKTQA